MNSSMGFPDLSLMIIIRHSENVKEFIAQDSERLRICLADIF